MASKNQSQSKKAMVPTWAWLVMGFLVVALVYTYAGGETPSVSLNTNDDDETSSVSTANPQMYVSTFSATGTNSSIWTITSSRASGKVYDNYVVEVDKDDFDRDNAFYNFTLGMTQIIEGGYDSNFKYSQKVTTCLVDDVVMQDSSNEDYVIWDQSASLIDSTKNFKIFDFQGTTEVSKTLQLKFNPNTATLSNMVQINDVGEDYEFNLNCGQLSDQKITVRMKN